MVCKTDYTDLPLPVCVRMAVSCSALQCKTDYTSRSIGGRRPNLRMACWRRASRESVVLGAGLPLPVCVRVAVSCSALQCVAVSCSECVVLCVGAPLPVSRRACVCVCVCARACICRYIFVRGYWRSGNQDMMRVLKRTATHCNILPHTATHCNTLQHTIKDMMRDDRARIEDVARDAHCNTLQHTATHCNTQSRIWREMTEHASKT